MKFFTLLVLILIVILPSLFFLPILRLFSVCINCVVIYFKFSRNYAVSSPIFVFYFSTLFGISVSSLFTIQSCQCLVRSYFNWSHSRRERLGFVPLQSKWNDNRSNAFLVIVCDLKVWDIHNKFIFSHSFL